VTQLVDTPEYVGLASAAMQAAIFFYRNGADSEPLLCVPMKGNNMTNQNQPGQPNQAPGQKPGHQQGGGSKPDQQSQAPGKDNRNPKEPLDQTSNSDT